MNYEPISVLKPEVVSKGLSVCRVKSGDGIVISAHRGDQRIIFELSSQEFVDFSEKLQEFGLSLEPDITSVIQDAVIDDLRNNGPIRQALTDKEPQPAE